ncbi:MAG: HEAT repeat domain-containing protein, partial [Minisyncoccia bacterium]
LFILKAIGEDKNERRPVRQAAVQALGRLGEKTLFILEAICRDKNEDWFVRQTAVQALEVIKFKKFGYKYLLATQKPLFATRETEQLTERIKKLQEITKNLRDEFGDKFIGLIILGSIAKGYSAEESDLDWGIIAKDEKISDQFRKMAKSFKLFRREYYYAAVNEKDEILSNQDILFCGLFFGHFNKLKKLQKNALEKMDKDQWDVIRRKIMKEEINLLKMAQRFAIEEEELKKIEQFACLLRTPPPYEEALEIVRKRAEEKEG